MPQIQWDLIKDWSEILVAIGSAIWFTVKVFGMIRADKAIFEERFDSIDKQLSELNDKKQDKEMSDLHVKQMNETYLRLTNDIGEVRKDVAIRFNEMQQTVSESNRQVSENLKGLAGTVGQLAGSIDVIKDIVLKSMK